MLGSWAILRATGDELAVFCQWCLVSTRVPTHHFITHSHGCTPWLIPAGITHILIIHQHSGISRGGTHFLWVLHNPRCSITQQVHTAAGQASSFSCHPGSIHSGFIPKWAISYRTFVTVRCNAAWVRFTTHSPACIMPNHVIIDGVQHSPRAAAGITHRFQQALPGDHEERESSLAARMDCNNPRGRCLGHPLLPSECSVCRFPGPGPGPPYGPQGRGCDPQGKSSEGGKTFWEQRVP